MSNDNWGWRARVGMFIVGNEAVPEAEWWAMAPPGVSVHAARVTAKSPWAMWRANKTEVDLADGDGLVDRDRGPRRAAGELGDVPRGVGEGAGGPPRPVAGVVPERRRGAGPLEGREEGPVLQGLDGSIAVRVHHGRA